ncbi:MAG: hypothetical protein AAF560_27515 [Acidobacteriota bacterium]
MGRIAEVTAITDKVTAESFLGRKPSPALVRAVALRADELRFLDPPAALGIAEAALTAQAKLPKRSRWPRLVALAWWTYGSICRALARFDEAEAALLFAARVLPPEDEHNRAEVLRRLAYLRADQRRQDEACGMIDAVLEFQRAQGGGPELGKELVASTAVHTRFGNYERVVADAEEALSLLPHNGDPFYLSAVYNLASARLELSSNREELRAVALRVAEAGRFAQPGTFIELRMHWLIGKLMRRLGKLDQAVAALERARVGIEERSNGFERALLMLDLAEVHLERGDAGSARTLALTSLGVMQALRNETEAYKALKVLHEAAAELALDRETVRTVRAALVAACT